MGARCHLGSFWLCPQNWPQGDEGCSAQPHIAVEQLRAQPVTSCGRREQDQPREVKEAGVTGMQKEEGGVRFSWGGGRGPFPPKGFVSGLWIYLMYVTLGGTRTRGSEVLQCCLSGDRRLTTILRAVGPGSCLLWDELPISAGVPTVLCCQEL